MNYPPMPAILFLIFAGRAMASGVPVFSDSRITLGLLPGGTSIGSPAYTSGETFNPFPPDLTAFASCASTIGETRFSASAIGESQTGALHAAATVETLNGMTALSALDSALVTTFWSDTLFLPGQPGALGFIDFHFAIDGSYLYEANPVDFNHVFSSLRLSMVVGPSQSTDALVSDFPHPQVPSGSVVNVSQPFTSAELAVFLGVPNELSVEMNLLAEVGAAASAPEPSALVLMGLGLALILIGRRTKRLRAAALCLAPVLVFSAHASTTDAFCRVTRGNPTIVGGIPSIPSDQADDHHSVALSSAVGGAPGDTWTGSGFCTASSNFGVLGVLTQVSVSSLQSSFIAATVDGDASFSDLITTPAGAFAPGFLDIRGDLEGVFVGLDGSSPLVAEDTLMLRALDPATDNIIAQTTLASGFTNGSPASGPIHLLVPIRPDGSVSFIFIGLLGAEVIAQETVGSIAADFSHTARITSVELLDPGGNPLGPVTIAGSSGAVYGADATAAPEPGTFGLMGFAGLVLAIRLLRTMRRQHRLQRVEDDVRIQAH